MSLDKAIEHGKEKRKPYRGAKACDPWCRNHGYCWICRQNRLHKELVAEEERRKEMNAEDYGPEEELAKKANDFEEEHGWGPDYGYEVFEEVVDEKLMAEQKYELHVICPHCEKECRVPIHVTTDDPNIDAMLSLLCSFGVRGKKKNED